MLKVRGLRKCFGDRVAVDDVSFSIDSGEIYGLLGPNGAGKTTSISMIAGILARDAGEVTIDVAYAGINFMDVMARRGDPGYASAWPYTPGLEVSGTVREVGPGFTTLAVGQPVVAYTPGGGLAEDLVEPFQIDDYTRWRLMEGLDDIGLTLRHAESITEFEARRPSWLPVTA